MPPTHIADLVQAGATNAGGTTLPVVIPVGGVAARDTLLLGLALHDATGGSVTAADDRDAANVYSLDVSEIYAGAGARAAILRCPVAVPLQAGDTITVTHPAANTRVVSVVVARGIELSVPLDQTAQDNDLNAAPSSGATGATGQADEFLFGVFASIGVSGGALVFTPGTGWTAAATTTADDGTEKMFLFPQWRVVSATGAYTSDGTYGAANNWAAVLATYRAARRPRAWAGWM